MPVSEYMAIVRRRLWILLLVPAVAGSILFIRIQTRPNTFRATATVAGTSLVGAPGSQYAGAQGIRAFVSNFSAAATSTRVIEGAAKAAGVTPGEIAAGTGVEGVGDSAVVLVHFETTRRDKAAPGAREVAAQTLAFLFQPQVDLAQKAAEESKKAVDEAQAALDDFTSENDLLLPDQEYQAKTRTLATLRQQQIQAEARGDSTTAAGLRSTVAQLQAELNTLAPKVAAYLAFVDRKSQATNRFNALQQDLERARAQLGAASPETVVSVGVPEPVSKLPSLLRFGGAAVGAGLFLAAIIVILLEMMARRQVSGPSPSEAGMVPETGGAREPAPPVAGSHPPERAEAPPAPFTAPLTAMAAGPAPAPVDEEATPARRGRGRRAHETYPAPAPVGREEPGIEAVAPAAGVADQTEREEAASVPVNGRARRRPVRRRTRAEEAAPATVEPDDAERSGAGAVEEEDRGVPKASGAPKTPARTAMPDLGQPGAGAASDPDDLMQTWLELTRRGARDASVRGGEPGKRDKGRPPGSG